MCAICFTALHVAIFIIRTLKAPLPPPPQNNYVPMLFFEIHTVVWRIIYRLLKVFFEPIMKSFGFDSGKVYPRIDLLPYIHIHTNDHGMFQMEFI
jgi:hypothetical protein